VTTPLKQAPGTSVVVPPGPSRTVTIREAREVSMLTTDNARALIQPLLKHGVSFDRILSETYLAVQKNPKLESCTPESMLTAVAQCVKWDLAIGEEVYLVPFSVKVKVPNGRGGEMDKWEDRAQAIRDYKGDIALVIRCGAARYVDAQNVYAKEFFEYEQGTNPFVRHRPIMDPSTRGELIGSYAVAKISAHDIKVVVMHRQEIDEIRLKHSKSWKEHWVDGKKVQYELEEIRWYGPKTCVHRIVKQLPKSPKLEEVMKAFALEEKVLDGEMEEIVPAPAIAAGAAEGAVAGPGTQVDEDTRIAVARPSAPASDQPAEFDPSDAPPAHQRSSIEEYIMPFGKNLVGTKIGDVPSDVLGRARSWAMENNPTGLAEFIEKSALLLDDRKNGDAPEPTPATDRTVQ
jgi:recombination protein RecT